MLWSRIRKTQSTRIDIPLDYHREWGIEVRETGVAYIDTTKESWDLGEKPRLTKVIIEAFTPLLR